MIRGEKVDRVGLVAEPVPQIAVRPALKSLHLIAPAEVHLADQARAVTVIGKLLRPGLVLGEDDPMIIPRRAVMNVLAAKH